MVRLLTLFRRMLSPSRSVALGYRPWLDGLRGIAILAVFVHHLQLFIYGGGPVFGWLFLPFGSLGVDIFFVLSGFLITTLLLEEHGKTKSISLKNFYIRRALRLLPALVVLLIFTVVFAGVFLPAAEARWTFNLSLIALFYGTNWVYAFGGLPSDWLGHLWSLAIEEQFYLVWPLALSILLRSRLSQRLSALLVFILIAAVCVYRILMESQGVTLTRLYAGSDTRADSLLVGCLVAMVISWRMLPFTSLTARVLKIAGFLSVVATIGYLVDFYGLTTNTLCKTGFTFFAVAVGGVILSVMSLPPGTYVRLLEARWLVSIGKLSYSLYLWHFFAISITRWVPIPSSGRAVLSVPIAFAFAACSFYVIEKPFLTIKARFAAQKENNVQRTTGQTRTHRNSLRRKFVFHEGRG